MAVEKYGPYYQPALTGQGTSPEAIDIMGRYEPAYQTTFATGQPAVQPYSPYYQPMATKTTQKQLGGIGGGEVSNPALEGAGRGGEAGITGVGGTTTGGEMALGPVALATLGGALSGAAQTGVEGIIPGAFSGLTGSMGSTMGQGLASTIGLSSAPQEASVVPSSVTSVAKVAGSIATPYASPIISAINLGIEAIAGHNISDEMAQTILGPLSMLVSVPVVGSFVSGLVVQPMSGLIQTIGQALGIADPIPGLMAQADPYSMGYTAAQSYAATGQDEAAYYAGMAEVSKMIAERSAIPTAGGESSGPPGSLGESYGGGYPTGPAIQGPISEGGGEGGEGSSVGGGGSPAPGGY